MDISAYLKRIHYSGPLTPDIETLRGLHRAQLFSVPFENLDIHLGRPIRLEEDALFDKIVTRRRGGFCYELNGLFAGLLAELGYGVTLLNARVVRGDGSYGIDYDHLALQVDCPGDSEQHHWLADVGFGDGPLEPLLLCEEVEQRQEKRLFKLIRENEYLVLTEPVTHVNGQHEWMKRYAFTLRPCEFSEFFPGRDYHCTSPDSTFTQKRLCTLLLPDGRATLSDRRLILTRNGKREEREVSIEEERMLLRDIFSIEL